MSPYFRRWSLNHTATASDQTIPNSSTQTQAFAMNSSLDQEIHLLNIAALLTPQIQAALQKLVAHDSPPASIISQDAIAERVMVARLACLRQRMIMEASMGEDYYRAEESRRTLEQLAFTLITTDDEAIRDNWRHRLKLPTP